MMQKYTESRVQNRIRCQTNEETTSILCREKVVNEVQSAKWSHQLKIHGSKTLFLFITLEYLLIY